MQLCSLMFSLSRLGGCVWGRMQRLLFSFGLFLSILSVHSIAAGFSLFGPNIDAVKDLLADPYSAKFENVETLPSGIVCGTVNSKNLYGAYSGKQMFAIAEGRAYLEEKSGMETGLLCVETRSCEDMKCVHKFVDEKLAQEEERALAPRIKIAGERLAHLCFSGLPDKSEEKRDCLLSLYECRKGQITSKHLQCLSDEYERRSKRNEAGAKDYLSPGYP